MCKMLQNVFNLQLEMTLYTVNHHSLSHGVIAVWILQALLVTQNGSLSEHNFIWIFENDRITHPRLLKEPTIPKPLIAMVKRMRVYGNLQKYFFGSSSFLLVNLCRRCAFPMQTFRILEKHCFDFFVFKPQKKQEWLHFLLPFYYYK